MMLTFARLIVVVIGVLLIALGLWLATYGSEGDLGLVVVGVITACVGVIGIAVLAFERMRYRSASTEVPPSVGPPGGDGPADALEPRFRPTSEVFVDPSSGSIMRVFADPETGERRYRVEG